VGAHICNETLVRLKRPHNIVFQFTHHRFRLCNQKARFQGFKQVVSVHASSFSTLQRNEAISMAYLPKYYFQFMPHRFNTLQRQLRNTCVRNKHSGARRVGG
jgi:hypothetical protein